MTDETHTQYALTPRITNDLSLKIDELLAQGLRSANEITQAIMDADELPLEGQQAEAERYYTHESVVERMHAWEDAWRQRAFGASGLTEAEWLLKESERHTELAELMQQAAESNDDGGVGRYDKSQSLRVDRGA